jgi:hydroxymethylglutaryl-CoA reductase
VTHAAQTKATLPATPPNPGEQAEAAPSAAAPEGGGETQKFYRLSIEGRLAQLRDESAISDEQFAVFGRPDPLDLEAADRLIENVVGVMPLPLGIARHFLIDGEEVIVPMAIEEPSVVAAASKGAKLLRAGGGITTSTDDPLMRGQIFLTRVKGFEACAERLAEAKDEILKAANDRHPNVVAAGGGARGFEVRTLDATPEGWTIVFELKVDVRDAMGANMINSMCEGVAPIVERLTGGLRGMRILSNLCDQRLVRAGGRVPKEEVGGIEGVRAIALASRMAEIDPYRACTHNKGVMNGVDGFLVACGQDWRAAEAGAHAYASQSGVYKPLATWREDEATGDLVGNLELPLAVGTVGNRVNSHPTVTACLALVGSPNAARLAQVAAAAGLAQNLAALRALAQEGIIRGHMALHHRATD